MNRIWVAEAQLDQPVEAYSMILSAREIRTALARRSIGITPIPAETSWSSTALDLRLAGELTTWKKPNAGGVAVPVCQLIFEWVDGTPEKGYTERFAIHGPKPA